MKNRILAALTLVMVSNTIFAGAIVRTNKGFYPVSTDSKIEVVQQQGDDFRKDQGQEDQDKKDQDAKEEVKVYKTISTLYRNGQLIVDVYAFTEMNMIGLAKPGRFVQQISTFLTRQEFSTVMPDVIQVANAPLDIKVREAVCMMMPYQPGPSTLMTARDYRRLRRRFMKPLTMVDNTSPCYDNLMIAPAYPQDQAAADRLREQVNAITTSMMQDLI